MNLYIGCLAALTISACSIDTERSDDVNQDRIHQDLTVTFNGQKNQTEASAQFRFGDSSGNTLELSGVSRVAINDTTLARVHNIGGTFYSGHVAGFTADPTFTFVDTNGKRYENTIRLVSTAFDAPPELSRAMPTTITWSGGPLEDGEQMELMLRDEADDAIGSSVGTATVVGATSLTVPLQRLDGKINGTKFIRLRRKRVGTLTESTSAGGRIEGYYETASQSVDLVD